VLFQHFHSHFSRQFLKIPQAILTKGLHNKFTEMAYLKNSVSPLKEPGYGQAEKRPSFSDMAHLKNSVSPLKEPGHGQAEKRPSFSDRFGMSQVH
jgi:hypothetical protein